MTGNVLLAARMEAEGLTQNELAEALNRRIESFTGAPGKLQDRHVRNWLTGSTRWPQQRQRRALEEEFGCTVAELGFDRPPPRSTATGRAAPSEDSVRRRTFARATTAALAGVVAPPPAPASAAPRIGMADLDRLDHAFTGLVASDNVSGGTIELEARALAFARRANELQADGSASQRVRRRLYQLAAAFTGTALWAALDSHAPGRAQRHLDRAMRLAGMSGNAEIQLRLWGHATVLATQAGRGHDAMAAAQAGRASPACRRDPLYRSLATARLALVQAGVGEGTAALRSLEQAVDSFDRADHAAPRAAWMGFYDRAELNGLSSLVMARLGMHDRAEAHLHRALGQLRPEYVRNRAYYRAHLALAQLRQGDAEHACVTAASVLPGAGGDSLTGRTEVLLATFDRELSATAPSTQACVSWTDRYTDRRVHQP